MLVYHWEVNREESPELAHTALAVTSLLCAVFLTAAIILGGFAEARLYTLLSLLTTAPCPIPHDVSR